MGKKRVIKKGSAEGGQQEGVSRSSGSSGAARKLVRGLAHIQATYNNTLISFSDEQGNVIAASSAGAMGFSGAKKATPFAAARIVDALMDRVRRTGMQEVGIFVKGVGSGRDSAVRAIANQGMQVLFIKDITPLPHNGPRPKKVRRV